MPPSALPIALQLGNPLSPLGQGQWGVTASEEEEEAQRVREFQDSIPKMCSQLHILTHFYQVRRAQASLAGLVRDGHASTPDCAWLGQDIPSSTDLGPFPQHSSSPPVLGRACHCLPQILKSCLVWDLPGIWLQHSRASLSRAWEGGRD